MRLRKGLKCPFHQGCDAKAFSSLGHFKGLHNILKVLSFDQKFDFDKTPLKHDKIFVQKLEDTFE